MTINQFHTAQNAVFHVSKAERNEAFYNTYRMSTADAKTFNDWAVTVLFYISVHYVDAVLSQDTALDDEFRDPQDHLVRNQAISQCSRLTEPVKNMYLNLYHRSRDARYNRISFPNDYISKLEKFSFTPAQQYLRKSLGLP